MTDSIKAVVMIGLIILALIAVILLITVCLVRYRRHRRATFCDAKSGIRFPHFAKVLVNGEYANPLFKYMQNEQGFAGFDPEHPLTPMIEKYL